MSSYRTVIIETFINNGEASRHSVRARPVNGQGLDVNMKVECSAKMREGHPVGTMFLLEAKVTSREGGTPFLYAYHNTPYRVVSDDEASQLLSGLG